MPEVNPADYEIVGPEPTDEEVREAEESDEWHKTDEVLRHLKKLQ